MFIKIGICIKIRSLMIHPSKAKTTNHSLTWTIQHSSNRIHVHKNPRSNINWNVWIHGNFINRVKNLTRIRMKETTIVCRIRVNGLFRVEPECRERIVPGALRFPCCETRWLKKTGLKKKTMRFGKNFRDDGPGLTTRSAARSQWGPFSSFFRFLSLSLSLSLSRSESGSYDARVPQIS